MYVFIIYVSKYSICSFIQNCLSYLQVAYWPEGVEKDKHEMTVSPGSTHICVAKSSPYIFEPIGCHGYKEPKFRWKSGSVELIALTHANSFYIESSHQIDDLTITMRPKSKSKDFHHEK